MSAPAYYTAYGGTPPARTGASHATIAPYGPFACADGESVYLAIQNVREWARFCADVLGRPELTDDDRFRSNALRVRHRAELHAAIASAVGGLTSGELVARLETAKVAYARMNTMARFLEHPQLAARHRWRDIDSPAGAVRTLLPPVAIGGVEPVMGAVPALGEHTAAILAELGFDAATIAAWRQEGTV